MKAATAALAQHLTGEVTTLATCWRVTRRDGVEFFFTDHDQNIAFDGHVYLARTGYSRTAIANDASMAVDNLDVDGVFDAAAITEQDMRAGKFDYAEVRVFLVNWADLTMGALKMRRGWFGEVILTEQGAFRTELRGMSQALQQRLGEIYTPECRADLGDHRCKVDLGLWTRAGTVTSATDRAVFFAAIDGAPTADGWWGGGLLTWATGANAGRSRSRAGPPPMAASSCSCPWAMRSPPAIPSASIPAAISAWRPALAASAMSSTSVASPMCRASMR
jgi:uncharacterized phage protein (TIGR02218 family)